MRKDEQRYYEELVAYSRASLLLYPYHLSDIMVKGLRVTPFQYYIKVLEAIMDSEKSYDSLPNFTAADCEYSWLNKFIYFINLIFICKMSFINV